MSMIALCRVCGGNLVYPSSEGDGAYPVGRMCRCPHEQPNPKDRPASYRGEEETP